MRIGIDARFLTHQQQGGFKTYTENLVRELAQLDRNNQYVFYTDHPGSERDFDESNITVKSVGGAAPIREQLNLPAEMSKDGVELAHYLCNTGPIRPPMPTILTVHDLIPCIPAKKASRQYRRDRVITAYWRYIMPRAVRKATHVITISQASRRDIINILGTPERRISVVYNGLNPDFRQLYDAEELSRIRKKHNLPKQFVMGFASADPRKNSSVLVEAAKIAADKFTELQVVLICATSAVKSSIADRVGLNASRPGLTLLDPVSGEDLVGIYNMAEALVFPSLYEGFGLPVIEAMACGTPVITSNISSMPEVAGDAAVLIDPRNANEIANTLIQVIMDPQLRVRLVRKGLERAATFSWQRAATETIAVYEKVQSELAPDCGGE